MTQNVYELYRRFLSQYPEDEVDLLQAFKQIAHIPEMSVRQSSFNLLVKLIDKKSTIQAQSIPEKLLLNILRRNVSVCAFLYMLAKQGEDVEIDRQKNSVANAILGLSLKIFKADQPVSQAANDGSETDSEASLPTKQRSKYSRSDWWIFSSLIYGLFEMLRGFYIANLSLI